MLASKELDYLRRAIQLAQETQKIGNLPIGALITLDGEILAEGKNSVWFPKYKPNGHAEIEALEAVPTDKWNKAADMTLYTTLEPCLMCVGAILLHRIGRIIFGSKDGHGGALCVFGHMPGAYENLLRTTEWIGPALPQECDELKKGVIAMALGHNPYKGRNASLLDTLIY